MTQAILTSRRKDCSTKAPPNLPGGGAPRLGPELHDHPVTWSVGGVIRGTVALDQQVGEIGPLLDRKATQTCFLPLSLGHEHEHEK